MRKPSNLKVYVNNKIKELSEQYVNLLAVEIDFNNYEALAERNEKVRQLQAQLKILFTIQKICEERKKY